MIVVNELKINLSNLKVIKRVKYPASSHLLNPGSFSLWHHHEFGTFHFACYVREEINVLIIRFLAVHFLQVLLSEVVRKSAHDPTVLVLLAPHNAHEEFWWDAEAEHAVDEYTHDFQVDQCLEQFSKVSTAFLEQLHVQSIQLHFKFGFHLKSLEIRLWIAIELL